jgi:HAD superfamily hydrolase (TIGR01509 family)
LDAVIWDYDGTLAETRCADEGGVRTIIMREPAAIAGAEIFWASEGQPILQRLELAWPGRGEEFLPLFDEPATPRIFRGVTRTVRELHHRGLGLAIVSSRQRSALEWGLRITGLRPLFAEVVGLDDVHEPKPSPEGLFLALDTLRVAPGRAVYVGDSALDMEAAHRAGMTAWRATWAYRNAGTDGALQVRTPHQVLDRLDEEPPVLDHRDGDLRTA